MKRKVSHTEVPSRFIQLCSHLHFLKASKSVTVRVESQEKGHRRGKKIQSPFKLNIKLAFMRTSSTVTDMNNAWRWEVIALICFSNFKTHHLWDFISYSCGTDLSYKTWHAFSLHLICTHFHEQLNNWLLLLEPIDLSLIKLHPLIKKKRGIFWHPDWLTVGNGSKDDIWRGIDSAA